MAREVEGYALGWHPHQGCRIRIKLADAKWSNWIPVSPADLAAAAAILKESPVHYQNGWLFTGPEAIKEEEVAVQNILGLDE